jgi:transcription-repair coupling factor (superfamily II helicase)
VYRRIAAVRSPSELDALLDEIRDRYGAPPESVLNLAEYATIRLMADRLGLESVDRERQVVVLKFGPAARLDPAWLFRVVAGRSDVALIPPATLKLDLTGSPAARQPVQRPPRKGGDPVAGGSWWAARARAGEVAPGFTRDEILRPAREDPRAEGGVFTRVGDLLRELSSGGDIS